MATNDLHENNNHFWMVWIDGKMGPTKKHFTFNEARQEAERLLRLSENQGWTARILETQSYGVIESVPVTWVTVALKISLFFG